MSVTRLRMSRAPPMHWPIVTLSITMSASSLLSFVRARPECLDLLLQLLLQHLSHVTLSSLKKVELRAVMR